MAILNRNRVRKMLAGSVDLTQIDSVYQHIKNDGMYMTDNFWVDKWYKIHRERLERGGIVRIPTKLAKLLRRAQDYIDNSYHTMPMPYVYGDSAGRLIALNGVVMIVAQGVVGVKPNERYQVDTVASHIYPVEPETTMRFPDVMPIINASGIVAITPIAIGRYVDVHSRFECVKYTRPDGGSVYVDTEILGRFGISDRAPGFVFPVGESGRQIVKFECGVRGKDVDYHVYVAALDSTPIESSKFSQFIIWDKLTE